VRQAAGVFVGLATLDVVHRVERPVGTDQKVGALRQDVCAGGPAANAAVTFAALGGRATLVTALGAHPLARMVARDLAGLDVLVVDAAPGVLDTPAVSLVRVVESTGERSVSSINAADSRAPAPAELTDAIARADVVLLDGHHDELARSALQEARSRRVPTLLDGGSWKAGLAQVLPRLDYVICSADFRVPQAGSVLDALSRLGVPHIAVTHGADAIEWATTRARGRLAVDPVTARDTLGAGDAFHGGAAHALASGVADWPDILEFAAQVARVRVQHVGPRDWLTALPARNDLYRR
jgi:sugar/nucleoside kinase (ribokinase family)